MNVEKLFTAAKHVCQHRQHSHTIGTVLVPQILLDELSDQVEAASVEMALRQFAGVPQIRRDTPLVFVPGPKCQIMLCQCGEQGGTHYAGAAPLPPMHLGCDCVLKFTAEG